MIHSTPGGRTGYRDVLLRLAVRLTRWTERAGAGLLLVIVVLNVGQVVFRYVLNAPLGWTEEVMRYALAWLTFIAAGAALMRGEHMALDLLDSYLTARQRAVLRSIVLSAVAAFAFVLVWKGIPAAFRNVSQTSPSAGIPMVVPYLSVAVGGMLILLKAGILMLVTSEEAARAVAAHGGS